MKQCLRCPRELDESEFGKDARKPDGKRPYCKQCAREMTAAYRTDETYRETERKFSRDYNREHKPERRAYRLQYESDPEVQENIRAHHRIWWKNQNEKKLFYGAKARAKKEGCAFNLEPEDIRIPEVCPILGVKLARGEGSVAETSPSLDRITPSLGYIKGNVQIISFKANTIKSNATPDELEKVAAFMRRLGRS